MTIGHLATIDCPTADDLASDLTVGTGVLLEDEAGATWCVHDDPRLFPNWEQDEEGGYVPPSADWRLGLTGLSSPEVSEL